MGKVIPLFLRTILLPIGTLTNLTAVTDTIVLHLKKLKLHLIVHREVTGRTIHFRMIRLPVILRVIHREGRMKTDHLSVLSLPKLQDVVLENLKPLRVLSVILHRRIVRGNREADHLAIPTVDLRLRLEGIAGLLFIALLSVVGVHRSDPIREIQVPPLHRVVPLFPKEKKINRLIHT